MAAQRRSASNAEAAGSGDGSKTEKSKAPGKPSGEKSAGSQRKLSFKEKHALETLPARIEALQSDIRKLQERISDADFYTKDPQGFAAASEQLASAENELSQLEEDWLLLEMKREELEG
jgi:ATP-binding cassette subfamily F protein uup